MNADYQIDHDILTLEELQAFRDAILAMAFKIESKEAFNLVLAPLADSMANLIDDVIHDKIRGFLKEELPFMMPPDARHSTVECALIDMNIDGLIDGIKDGSYIYA